MRFLYFLLLPIIWVPIVGLIVMVAPDLPWYVWVYALVFTVLYVRRRRLKRQGERELSPDSAQFSPFSGGRL